MSDKRIRIEPDDTEGHGRKITEDTTAEDATAEDAEGHGRKITEDTTGDDTEGHGRKIT
jgi:hypothetical protein